MTIVRRRPSLKQCRRPCYGVSCSPYFGTASYRECLSSNLQTLLRNKVSFPHTHLATITAKSSAQVNEVVLARTYTVFFWVSVGMISELSADVKAASVGPSKRISTLNWSTEGCSMPACDAPGGCDP